MEDKPYTNSIPKYVVKMEDLYDLKDRFKKVTNSNTHISTLKFELINLGTPENPQNINLGLSLQPKERTPFIKLLKTYKYIFEWDYSDLKTYDTSIIQHTIPMISDDKHVQQKIRKIHPNLESQIKSELNKMLKAKVIFAIRNLK